MREPRKLQNKRFIVELAIQDMRKMMKLKNRNNGSAAVPNASEGNRLGTPKTRKNIKQK